MRISASEVSTEFAQAHGAGVRRAGAWLRVCSFCTRRSRSPQWWNWRRRTAQPCIWRRPTCKRLLPCYRKAKDAFIPSISFGSGLPAFPEIGFTGSLPTVWDGSMQSLVFSSSADQIHPGGARRRSVRQLALKDAKEQVALDASTAYIEMDTVNSELEAVREQEQDATRLVDHRAAAHRCRRRSAERAATSEVDGGATQAESPASRNSLRNTRQAACHAHRLARSAPSCPITPAFPRFPPSRRKMRRSSTPALNAAKALAKSKMLVAKGDQEHLWRPRNWIWCPVQPQLQ